MAVHLVTGYAGREHVTANDAAAFNSALFGVNSYVLESGDKFAATVLSNNSIRISNGEAFFQGRHIRINVGDSQTVAIANGSQGMKRNDLIVVRYSKNAGTGVESADIVVIKGTPSTTTAVDPAITNANISGGALTADMPLYRIPINGLTVGTPVQLYTLKPHIPMFYSGTSAPTAGIGEVGDIYIQY